MVSVNKTKKFNKENIINNKEISKIFRLNFLVFVGIIAVGIGQFFVIITSLANLGKPQPSLVQTESGTLKVKSMPNWYRDSETISDFTEKVFTYMFTWDGYLLPTSPSEVKNPKIDEGIEIKTDEGKLKIPTQLYEASFAFEPLFREQYLNQIAKIVPERTLSGEWQIVFLPREILPPETVADGKYEQSIVADILVMANEGKRLLDIIPFRKTIVMQSSLVPDYQEFATKEALLINEYRQSGLEIVDVKNYEPNKE